MVNKRQPLIAASFLPLIIVSALALVFLLYRPSQAAPPGPLIVNSTADTDDGSCDAADCTLREAVNAANEESGTNTIMFFLPGNSTINLASAQLPTITDTLTIDGSVSNNLIIYGPPNNRILQIDSGTAVTITTLHLSNGVSDSGGAIFNNGGLLTIIGSAFTSNTSWDPFTGGGAITNWDGTLNVTDSFFNMNSAANMGGGIFNYLGTANIHNSTFTGNQTNYDPAGGVDRVGGAIANYEGTLNISNSTISANLCFGFPEPCFGGGVANNGLLNLTNSTFSGNQVLADPSAGGGIYNYDGGQMNISNTIIANSLGGDCIANFITSNDNNLIEDGSCNPDFTGDPLLGSLQNNGGSTWTHALSSLSMAIDNGDNTICATIPVNNLDQRGVIRPLDGNGDGIAGCDIGAYEHDGPPPAKFYFPLVIRK